MELRDAINQFYYDMTVSDIRLLSTRKAAPGQRMSYHTIMYLDIISYLEGRCTVSSLAETLRISKPAVTMKVNELVAAGLVQKVQSAEDKRIFYLRVAPEVEQSLEDYDRPLRRAIQAVERDFPPDKIEAFCEILSVFSRNFQKGY